MHRFQDARTVEQLVGMAGGGAVPDCLFFWGHRQAREDRVSKSCFSQWFEAAFTVDGAAYTSAEHFMMAEKARVFGDMDIHRQVLAARTPAEAKALGRRVAGFDEQVWQRERYAVVLRANQAKFGQNAALGDFLRGTANHVLVEASPVDPIWGIGLAADHEDAPHPARWPGLNLLGFALMEVRAGIQGP